MEAAVYEHPDVAEAAVFGVPDERLGELVSHLLALPVPHPGRPAVCPPMAPPFQTGCL